MVNVFNFSNGSPAGPSDLVTLANRLEQWEYYNYRGCRHNDSTFVLMSLRSMHSVGSPVLEQPPISPRPGANGGGNWPSFMTVAVKHTTGLSGRSYRGRTYIMPMSTDSMATPDTITDGWVITLTNVFNELRTLTLTDGFQFGIVSRYSGIDGSGDPIPRATGIFTPINSSAASSGIDTNRHRKVKGI